MQAILVAVADMADVTMTGMCEWSKSDVTWRHSSMPLMPGRAMSVTMMSTSSSPSAWTAFSAEWTATTR